jgi:hypothetical protein
MSDIRIFEYVKPVEYIRLSNIRILDWDPYCPTIDRKSTFGVFFVERLYVQNHS